MSPRLPQLSTIRQEVDAMTKDELALEYVKHVEAATTARRLLQLLNLVPVQQRPTALSTLKADLLAVWNQRKSQLSDFGEEIDTQEGALDEKIADITGVE